LGLILWAGGSAALAQSLVNYEKVLIPVAISSSVRGDKGSVFKGELVARNSSNSFVHVRRFDTCVIGCSPEQAAPKSTFYPPLAPGADGMGFFLYVARPLNDAVSFNYRVQDVSRQSQTWGTQIPVIRERDLFTSAIHILNVPVNSSFRQALRIYDFDSNVPQTDFFVRIFRVDSVQLSEGAALVEVILSAATVQAPQNGPNEMNLSNLAATYPVISTADRVRIEVEPLRTGTRFWAFVSVTNNETQHVTTIFPQR
jgi:hypothetical protein